MGSKPRDCDNALGSDMGVPSHQLNFDDAPMEFFLVARVLLRSMISHATMIGNDQ